MSYPLSLDEVSTERLEGEYNRRRSQRAKGNCDYCEQPVTAQPCRFPDRHTTDETPMDCVTRVLSEVAGIIYGFPPGSRKTYIPEQVIPKINSLMYCEALVKLLVGDGYRLLMPGEITEKGDEHLGTFKRFGSGFALGWVAIPNPGWMVGGGSAFARRKK